ncbi:MAG: hypothetical protein PHP64_03115 [Actinomycetota bacterium]|nr:hypothetical protein [Actinomycetota bacterium]
MNPAWGYQGSLVCPVCGREQRCGCEKCHNCGAALVSGLVKTAETETRENESVEVVERKVEELEKEETSFLEERISSRELGAILSVLAFVLGICVFLVAFVDVARLVRDISGKGFFVESAVAGLRLLGYSMAYVLYANSTKFLLGTALLTAGILVSPPYPFRSRNNWVIAMRILLFFFGIVSALYILASLLVLIPAPVSLILKNLIPPLYYSIPVCLITGAGMGFITYFLSVFSRRIDIVFE